MRDYTKINAWAFADDLTVAIYAATKSFPKDEVYALTSQIRRASYSVPSNIAEGAARDTQKDYLHFLYIARGSLTETRYFIHLSGRLGYLTAEQAGVLQEQADECLRVLGGLIRSVEKEAGKITRTIARTSSMLVLSLGLAYLRSKV